MNWKQFKDWMEAQGVKDDDQIWFIDVDLFGCGEPTEAEKDKCGWAIT